MSDAALQSSGRNDEALDLHLTAAHRASDSSPAHLALLGAIPSLIAAGDRAFAQALYRRLLESSAVEPQVLSEARTALHAGKGVRR